MKLLIALIICLSGWTLVLGTLPTPTISGDVVSFENNPNKQTITIECDPGTDETDALYVQIYKKEMSFPQVDGDVLTWPGTGGNKLLFLLSTNEIRQAYLPQERYTVTKDGNKFVVSILRAKAEDSGVFACRTTLNNTDSTEVESAVSEGTANITILAAIDGMALSLTNGTSFADGELSQPVGDTVALNEEDDQIIACQVFFTTGLPVVSGFWVDDGGISTGIDMSAWHLQIGYWNIVVGTVWGITKNKPTNVMLTVLTTLIQELGNWDKVITNWTVDESGYFGSVNRSIFLWAKTSEIPNVGGRDGQDLKCTASFPGTEFPQEQLKVAVTSTTPPDPTDGGDGGGGADSMVKLPLFAAVLAAFISGKLSQFW